MEEGTSTVGKEGRLRRPQNLNNVYKEGRLGGGVNVGI